MVLIKFRKPCTDVGSIYDTAPCHWRLCSVNTVKKATNRFSHFFAGWWSAEYSVLFFTDVNVQTSWHWIVFYSLCTLFATALQKKKKKNRQCTVNLSQSLSDDSLELEEEDDDDDDDDWGFLFFCLFLCFPCFLFFLLFFLWLFSFFFFFLSSDEELDLLRFFFFFVGSSSLDDDTDLMNDIIKWIKNHDPAE